jgi:hypothetical protein
MFYVYMCIRRVVASLFCISVDRRGVDFTFFAMHHALRTEKLKWRLGMLRL